MPANSKRPRTDSEERRAYHQLQGKIARLQKQKNDLLEAGSPALSRLSFIEENNEDIQLYTGFENYSALMTFYELLELGPNGANLKHHRSDGGEGRLSELSLENEMLLTLMKLRLGLTHEDLAFRFGIENVALVFDAWLGLMDERLRAYVPLSDEESIVPLSFVKYPRTRMILHDLELKLVETDDWQFSELNSLVTKRKTIIGLSPKGRIIYVSTIGENPYSTLKESLAFAFKEGDTYMSTLEQKVCLNVKESTPHFVKSSWGARTQFEDEFWKIVNRVHEFRILDSVLPFDEAETILNVCCRLMNCQSASRGMAGFRIGKSDS